MRELAGLLASLAAFGIAATAAIEQPSGRFAELMASERLTDVDDARAAQERSAVLITDWA